MVFKAFDLTGKVATITGGNGGIGLGMAEALAQAGASVCIWGTSEAKNVAAVAKLRAHGTEILALRCDVGDEAAVEKAFADTVGHFGRVDAFFANAGVIGSSGVKSFVEMTSEEWRRVMRVNLDGAFYTLRAAARHMIDGAHGGALVVTSSLAAISGPPRNQHYAASKGGVISMMHALAVELARYKIRANAIQPGWIDTPMNYEYIANLGGIEKVEAMLETIQPLGTGRPEQVAAAAVFLASDESSLITGTSILVDGGLTAQ